MVISIVSTSKLAEILLSNYIELLKLQFIYLRNIWFVISFQAKNKNCIEILDLDLKKFNQILFPAILTWMLKKCSTYAILVSIYKEFIKSFFYFFTQVGALLRFL